LFRHRCRGPPQPPPPAGAGVLADPVLNLGRDIHESLVEQAEVLIEGHHQLDDVEDVGLDIHVHGSTVAEGEVAEGEVAEGEVAEGEIAEGEVAEEVDQLELTVPPLRINMRSLTIQRVSPVRIDLRRVPPIRIRRQELEAELPTEDADVSIIHGDDTVELIPGNQSWPEKFID
jgi:hypothetical protein